MSRIRLTRAEATGNVFLVAVDLEGTQPLAASTVVDLCDRRRGPGADGVIRVLAGTGGADLTMELTNADGGRAELSGNGLRCLAAVAIREGLAPGLRFTVATGAGPRVVEWAETPGRSYARTHMGEATFDPSEIPLTVDSALDLKVEAGGTVYDGDAVSMGNPHLVLYVDDPLAAAVEAHGPLLEHDARFPHRANVEFVTVASPRLLRMRVWERGVGETRSCGTGACAAAASARRRGLVEDSVEVEVLGGTLRVDLQDGIWLGGPVVIVGDLDVEVPDHSAVGDG